MGENYNGHDICVCGFGEDYFVKKNNQTICTVCDGLVNEKALPAEGIQDLPSTEKKTVMIIDDRDSFRGRTKTMLINKGFNTLEAPDGLSGVKMITEIYGKKETGLASGVDVILLDLIMPGALDGKSTLATIKTIAPEIPVIILTATPPKQELLKQLAEMGAQRYLNKTVPNLSDLLVKNIRSLLS